MLTPAETRELERLRADKTRLRRLFGRVRENPGAGLSQDDTAFLKGITRDEVRTLERRALIRAGRTLRQLLTENQP